MMLKRICLLLVVIAAAMSHTFAFDPISIGIRAGVPLTDILPEEGFLGVEGRQPFTTDMRRFTIGPAVELGLPLGLAAEFDALYKRFEQTGPSITPGETVTEGVSSWEFVLVGKYRPGIPLLRPYVEAGVSFNRLSGFLTAFRTLPSPPPTQPTDTETRAGLVAGVGLELSLPGVRIVPGIRYSHWGEGDPSELPSTNLLDFQVGILF